MQQRPAFSMLVTGTMDSVHCLLVRECVVQLAMSGIRELLGTMATGKALAFGFQHRA
jgi:hypothetical protein